ncbi:uncharacterized protein B0I36DRAFT_367677 [Microdochium trichocladiopsis]|uniref:Transcription initiation factor TFIID subunit 4 n=1 Tax=Microdochium trichocladiopsis TaxID=1682393 RepID=A0A9P8XZ86_9PEZI|nr:uncharacterized protein B0I36DRAFT_367677 [Microdochium trichocladiopsis]KAH7021249.1 hypothetical protein B0I36DRAFT_367677 [Microdochium trichocladiopsis]
MTPGAGAPSPVNAPLAKPPGQPGNYTSPFQRNGSATPVPTPIQTQPPSQAPSQPPTPGPTNSGLPMPVASAGPMPQPTATTPQPSTPSALLPTPQAPPNAPYTNATLMPIPSPSTPAPMSEMPPPPLNASASFSAASQAKAPTKSYAYEMDDMLAGTGINLEEEQELMNEFEMREGLGSHRPGGRKTLYGAGAANQPPEEFDAKTQEELAAEAADKAWNEAAHRLAVTRTVEITSHLLDPGLLHRRMAAIASRNNLSLNLDLRSDGKSQYMGRLAAPDSFPRPAIKVSTAKATDGTIVTTHGSFIPKEAFLVDQIALLSIATREHLRGLLTDANKKSISRQQKTHGAVPPPWTPAASPGPAAANGVAGASPASAGTSGISPTTTSKKRPVEAMSNGLPTPVSDASPTVNPLVEAMRALGKANRSAEEARYKKRQRRLDQANKKEAGADGTRAGSAAPGAEAGETKAPTKKEAKKSAKMAEASSTTVNNTLSLFAGGKKKKKYSWMAGGGAASGPGTPQPQVGGAPGTPGGANTASQKPNNGPLTPNPNPRHLPGVWREDGPTGKNIQLRDWILVLEDRGQDIVALQKLYDKLDKSDLGDKVGADTDP